MKILIISDNHGDQEILEQITARWQDQVDLMIHCGDSEMAPTLSVMKRFKVAVLGNNDLGLDYPLEQTVEKAGQRVYATHGHRYQVNSTLTPLMLKGQEQQAAMVCYGHTHQLAVTEAEGMLMINPGSISLPRGSYAHLGGTFAVVELNPDRFVVDYYDRTSQPVDDLHFVFDRKEGRS